MQSRDKHKYPFNFDRSRDSIWKLFHTFNQQKDLEPYTDVTNPDNTNAFKFRMLKQLTKETTVSLLVRVAMRRYLTGNQMVIVWRTFTEGEGIFNGVHCSESGWTRARPCENGTTIEMYFKLKLLGFLSMTARFHDAASLFREIAQGRKARILNGLASFPHDKNLRTRVESQTKSRK
ncbi:hypothetical protein PHMEG_00013083 [Phytophthora megakarya]|uniref:Uncharacterized protein n=1 Tax=Phytophthora megakarya TaxID=4795 RepID=A0A225W9S2_9STRA|nr:hypothetical protein PHMEG_00013083 [Phytophthora megakarya]